MKASALLIGIAVSLVLLPRAEAWGPSLDQDEASGSIQFGSSFFLQEVSVKNHFKVPKGESLNLSWMLGYAYSRTSGPDATTGATEYDDSHALRAGLAWGIGDRAELRASATYQVLPSENYTQGNADFRFFYTIPLSAEKRISVNDVGSSPEENYYVSQELNQDLAVTPMSERFPQLQLGILGSFNKEDKAPTTTGRTAGSQLTADSIMNEMALGPSLGFKFNKHLGLEFHYLSYSYDQDVANFLTATSIGGVRPKVDMAVSDLEDLTPVLLVFPKSSASASLTSWVAPKVRLRTELNYQSFEQSGATGAGLVTSSFSFGGVLDFFLGRSWRFGGMLDFTAANAGYHAGAGGVILGHAL